MTFLHNPTQWKSVLSKHGDCLETKTHLSHPTMSTFKSCQKVFVGNAFKYVWVCGTGQNYLFSRQSHHILLLTTWWLLKCKIFRVCVCLRLTFWACKKINKKKICAPAQNNTFIFQSAHLHGTGWAAGSDKEGICHRVMNEPVRLETVWSCLLTPGLISLIESRAAMHEQTYAHSLQLGLACPFLFVCTFHYGQ